MKINLIIDGNYILNKNVFSLLKHNMLYGELRAVLDKSLNNFKSFYFFDNIFFVSDSGSSWRKNLYPEYKTNRTKSQDIDWEFIYTCYREFKDELPANVTVLEAPHIEGDDWIAELIFESNKKGYSNLVISNDHDLIQLMKISTSPLYMNFMGNEIMGKEKVFLPSDYEVFLDHLSKESSTDDIFTMSNTDELLGFIKTYCVKRTHYIVQPNETIITKIISGDKSDNIKSCYQKMGTTGKIRGIGDTGAKKLFTKYIEEFGEIDLNDDELFDNIADLIRESKKLTFGEVPKIINRLSDNMQLISLFNIPDHITKEMKEKILEIDKL
jgi:5'-3' exonuclease